MRRMVTGMVGRVVRALGGIIVFAFAASEIATAAVTWPADFDEEVIAAELDAPTAIAYAPDGRIFITEKAGRVRVISATGQLLPGAFTTVDTSTEDDLGLVGITLDPDFLNNHYVYLAYTTNIVPPSPLTSYSKIHRITRWTADGDVAIVGSEVTIVDNIHSDHTSHLGGALRFGPDGKLYVAIGDGASYNTTDPLAIRAQDLSSINGKILRINRDGSAPNDNPYYTTPGADPRVWQRGFRNPFKATFRPGTNKLYINEVGWGGSEEINFGPATANFGWPCYEGNGTQFNYYTMFPATCGGLSPTPPLYAYPHIAGVGAIIGGAFVEGSNYPAQYQGKYFIADYSQRWMKYVEVTPNDQFVSVTDFATGDETFLPVEVALAPDGNLNYLNIATDYTIPSGTLNRIVYVGAGNHAPRPSASASPKAGYAPLPVSFSGLGTSDVDGDPLSYHWKFGDGVEADGVTTSHTYLANGTYVAVLQVNDTHVTREARVTVIVGSLPPVATISVPSAGRTFVDGEIVDFSGSADDPDEGPLGPNALRWTVIQHHNTHQHHYLDAVGPGGSFIAEGHGTTADTISYELVLTATDASGLSDQVSMLIAQNHDPVANAGRDQSVACALTPTVVLDGSWSEIHDPLITTFAWTQLSGPTVTLSGANTLYPRFVAPATTGGAVLTFQLGVSDGNVASGDTVTVSVPDLTDSDGDLAPACNDCAPANGVSRPPVEATGLRFAADKTTLSWDPVAGATSYALERGSIWKPFVYNHDCDSQGLSSSTATASAIPPAGTAYYYLARAASACGLGDVGTARDGRPRTNAACGAGGPSGAQTITFNDMSADTPLDGPYPAGVIDWGQGAWLTSPRWGLFTTNNLSFIGPGTSSASFAFFNPRFLLQVDAFNGGTVASTVTLSCDGTAVTSAEVSANQMVTIPTTWTTPCTSVAISSTNGWNTNFDNLVVY
jgi:glucose/arabinose dehydrogenase/PKD repeat protein